MKKFYLRLERYIKNISWMMFERVVTLCLGLLVSIFIAREVGPNEYGIYSYSLSIITILTVVAQFGLNGIVIRDLTKNNDNSKIISSVIVIKFAFAVLSMFLLFLVSLKSESKESLILLCLSGVIILSPLETLDYWFQSRVKYKYVTISRVISSALGAILKCGAIALSMGIVFVAISHTISVLIFTIILIFFFFHKVDFKFKIKIEKSVVMTYLKEGWIVFLGTFFSIIYLKIDQVMISHISGNAAVGVYAVAAQLSEAWYFIPVTIVASVFPKLVKLRDNSEEQYYSGFQKLLNFLFCFALVISSFVYFLSDFVIDLIYGSEYHQSSDILKVHVFAGLFVFMRAAFSRWIIIEKEYYFSILTQGLGAVTNIVLNLVFINEFGAIGAAYATLLSYFVASYLSLAIYPKTRKVFKMMSYSIVFPIVSLKKLYKYV